MKPALRLSLAEMQSEALEEITWLESVAAKYPKWKWPLELLPYAKEFQKLVASHAVDPHAAHDFTERLKNHIRKNRLKGIEPFIWRAEAFETLANENHKD